MSSVPGICLNMIVKNESSIIERCLRSISPVISYYVICDTGSTDDTPAKIKDFFSQRGLDGEVHRIPFVDFQVTRNRALDLCRNSATNFDYILLADADMELNVDNPEFKLRLGAPAYSIRQTNGISYYNTRLIRRDQAFRYVGATHEYLDTVGHSARLSGLWFYDYACGQNRAGKRERDLELLTWTLKKNPSDSRAMFYLAHTLKDCARYLEAIEWYQKRADAGGWEEEVWYSLYMIGCCHECLGNEAQFIRYSLEAYNLRPHRAEPLYRLARHSRITGRSDAALMFCEAAERVPYPVDDSLFIEDYVYHTGIKEEMSISALYCGREEEKERGYQSCLELITSPQSGELARSVALRNFFFYLKPAARLFKSYEVKELPAPLEAGLPCTSPTLWIGNEKKCCVLRSVNYQLLDDVTYDIFDPDQIVRTRNYFLTLDDNFDVLTCSVMDTLTDDSARFPSPVEGFEDCRLFFCRGRFWCSCTVRDRNAGARCEVAVLRLDDDRNIADAHVLRGFRPELHQKNWLPLVSNDELYFIYSTDPTVMLKYDFACNDVELFRTSTPGAALGFFRGSSQAVQVEEGWLYLVHETKQVNEYRRFYQHRFVLMSEDFRVKRFTEPFCFLQKGIEFCTGLGYDSDSGRFVASFGVNDRHAYLAFFDEDSVFSRMIDASR